MKTKRGSQIEDYIEENAINITRVRLPALEPIPAPVVQRTIITEKPDCRKWEYILPWPPSVNTYWKPFVFRAKGPGIKVAGSDVKVMMRMVLSAKGKEYKQLVENSIGISGNAPHTLQRLAVVIHAFQPDRRPTDLDNRLKSLLDSLQGAGVFEDDEQIDDLRIIRGGVVKRKNARVHVSIAEIS